MEKTLATTVQSRKAKGRNLQKWVRDKLLSYAEHLTPDDIRSTSMGSSGVDVLLSSEAKKIYPVAIECKNTEKVSLWESWLQCEKNSEKEKGFPLLIVKRNRSTPLAVMDADRLLHLLSIIGQRE